MKLHISRQPKHLITDKAGYSHWPGRVCDSCPWSRARGGSRSAGSSNTQPAGETRQSGTASRNTCWHPTPAYINHTLVKCTIDKCITAFQIFCLYRLWKMRKLYSLQKKCIGYARIIFSSLQRQRNKAAKQQRFHASSGAFIIPTQ